ncbi:malonate transporter subunit MadM [Aquirufa regiilacus]|uniref:Malonate transporter subunit MadM n=1 Tax=Aquirufa regiilacus TaxID=3024868 RepID=A0ABU3TQ93_9BACT|nr:MULTISPECIES: malonate transporter subunit MadM [unclassified Aquirufa]MDT8887286.1 malonate transporter subunit MadM [Aquirufa sp. LEPPI-3A]MDU0808039.1 malonate transporter subunit MadM [Aquirufa sp. LEOWEIH-7C]
MEYIIELLDKNGLIMAFLVTGILVYFSEWISLRVTNKKLPGSAIAIFLGLVIAYIGGVITDGKNGIADIPGLSGFKVMGGPMFRDFAIVSTAMGASFAVIKKTGSVGILSLFLGVIFSFVAGVGIAYAMGIHDAASLATIGAGACTFVVGPVTGTAVGASSEIIAISIAAGVVKSILVTIGTPFIAPYIGLNNPKSAMIFGGLMGTTSGTAAGLAATDPKLVPYGAMTATFYTGLGCLMCPSVLYFALKAIL